MSEVVVNQIDGIDICDWDVEGDFGGGEVSHDGLFSLVTGNIHEVPITVDLSEHLNANGLPVPEHAKWGSDVRLVAIGTSFSIQSAGPTSIRSVGAKVKFRDDESDLNTGILCRVAGLQPSPEYVAIAELDASFVSSALVGFNATTQNATEGFTIDPVNAVLSSMGMPKADGEMSLGVDAQAKGKLALSHKFYRCRVAAWGVGSYCANWELYRDSADLPLTNRDLHVWTYVAVDRFVKEWTFEVQLQVSAWCGLLPRRFTSVWVKRSVSF